MLRALLALLVLANVVFFAWTHGALAWFAAPPRHGEREPERLAAQVRPELIVVAGVPASAARPAAAATAAPADAVSCLEAGPYADAGVAAAEAALAQAGLAAGSVVREAGRSGGAWLVFAGRYPDPGTRQDRAAELERLNLAFEPLAAPPDLAPGFVLSRHGSRDAAELALAAAMAQVGDRPLRDVRVVAVPAGLAQQQYWLRAAAADAALRQRLEAIGGFRPCAGR